MAEFSKDFISEKVYNAVAESSGISRDSLRGETELIKTLNMDSLAIFELVIELEETFDLKIPDEDIDNIITIDNAIEYICKSFSL